MNRVLLVLHRLGPYHLARIRKLQPTLEMAVLETRPGSQEYPWPDDTSEPCDRFQLQGSPTAESDPPQPQLDQQLQMVLASFAPSAIVCVGWADKAYQHLLVLAHRTRIPVVIVSDSRQRDQPRSIVTEAVKRLLLRGYSSALVAGQESRSYLERLGFPPAAIFQPWDVVDHAFFSATPPPQLQVPHFLCVGRFIPEKNHALLLQSYGQYQHQGGRWALLLVGTGPLTDAIRQLVQQLPDPSRCQIQPFLEPEPLRQCYANASTLVLASRKDTWGLVVNEAMASGLPCLVSSACGCAVDLIEHGVTGWCFDPSSPAALTELMHTAAQQPAAVRARMVAAALQRLQAFSPQAFAMGFQQAVEQAISVPRFSRRAAFTAQLLSRRSSWVLASSISGKASW